MGTTALLTLLLPYLPNLLEFIAGRLDAYGRPVPEQIGKTEDTFILETVRTMVEEIGKAHPDWTDEEKRRTAASASRAHLEKSAITLTDSQINLLIELYAARAAALRREA